MNNPDTQTFECMIEKVTRWAEGQPDILALVLVGSWARGAATDSSDIDLVMVTTNPDFYLKNKDWAAQFGVVEKTRLENYGLVTSRRVWYGGGLEVEFGVTEKRWVAEPLDPGTRKVIHGGMRILFEREKILGRHLRPDNLVP